MKLKNSLVQSVICLTLILGVGFSVSGCGKKVAATAAKKEEAKANENAGAPKADDKGDKKPPAVELEKKHKDFLADIVNYVLSRDGFQKAADKDVVATAVLKCSAINADQKAGDTEYAPLEMKLALVKDLEDKKDDTLGTVEYLSEDKSVVNAEEKVYLIKSGSTVKEKGVNKFTPAADGKLCAEGQSSEITVTFTSNVVMKEEVKNN